MNYAIQNKTFVGWIYTGTNIDGTRALFDTVEDAEADLATNMAELRNLGHLPDEWRVIRYDSKRDDETGGW